MGLTPCALAKATGVPRRRIERLANEPTAMTADTALRLAWVFGVAATSWMNTQFRSDIETAEDEMAEVIKTITARAA